MGYNIPMEEDKNMLTNLKEIRFTISEIEVWEVREILNDEKYSEQKQWL